MVFGGPVGIGHRHQAARCVCPGARLAAWRSLAAVGGRWWSLVVIVDLLGSRWAPVPVGLLGIGHDAG